MLRYFSMLAYQIEATVVFPGRNRFISKNVTLGIFECCDIHRPNSFTPPSNIPQSAFTIER